MLSYTGRTYPSRNCILCQLYLSTISFQHQELQFSQWLLMNLTVILLLPFDLGSENHNIHLQGETQTAGAGGHLPDCFAPQESYFQAFLTTPDAH